MNVSVGQHSETFIERIVRSGRDGAASEVVRKGLRLVEEREAKPLALRHMLDASIAAGSEATDALKAKAVQLQEEGS